MQDFKWQLYSSHHFDNFSVCHLHDKNWRYINQYSKLLIFQWLFEFKKYSHVNYWFWISFFIEWSVLLPQTRIGGPHVNFGKPIPATIAFKIPNEDAWIVGVHDHVYMKMVKIQITGENTFTWIASKYKQDGLYNVSCLTSFTNSCFKGNNQRESSYQVLLVAKFKLLLQNN